ncbi:hypothetical protein NDU88_001264 [Pleurodeles waltl]|uniref:Uncharacterized protein n=1 Tax=Pleurodeles waltl TaxID=8319 RepID=A0AAV7NCY8_PLEWA|nr:hypothetical protein NDU88_001264 [Pleurodeles waltl]
MPRGRCGETLGMRDEVTGTASIRWAMWGHFCHTAGAASIPLHRKSGCIVPAQQCVDPVGHASKFWSHRWRCIDLHSGSRAASFQFSVR